MESLEDICAVLGRIPLRGAGPRADQNLGVYPRRADWRAGGVGEGRRNRRKGEMVLIVEGFKAQEGAAAGRQRHAYLALLRELPLKKAAAGREIHGVKMRYVEYALEQQE